MSIDSPNVFPPKPPEASVPRPPAEIPPTSPPSIDAPGNRRLTPREFNQQLWRAIVPPLLLLAAHAAIISLLFIYFIRASDWSRDTEQVVSGISDVERLMVNMETSTRGFLLTGDDSFLEPYSKARPRVEPREVADGRLGWRGKPLVGS